MTCEVKAKVKVVIIYINNQRTKNNDIQRPEEACYFSRNDSTTIAKDGCLRKAVEQTF